MKIASDRITRADLVGILQQKIDERLIEPQVEIRVEERRSRTHKHGFEVDLYAMSKDKEKRRPSASQRVPSHAYGATWDEWGWFLAQVFEDDPGAKADRYNNFDDFHRKTDYSYA